MIKLYWSPRSRSFSALWLMEETGQPYERVLTDISTGAQKAPDYLEGQSDGQGAGARRRRRRARRGRRDLRLYRRPLSRGQARARGGRSAPRASYLQWLFFSPSCIEPAIIQIFTKIEMTDVDRRLGQRDAGVRRAGGGAAKRGRGFSARNFPPPTS